MYPGSWVLTRPLQRAKGLLLWLSDGKTQGKRHFSYLPGIGRMEVRHPTSIPRASEMVDMSGRLVTATVLQLQPLLFQEQRGRASWTAGGLPLRAFIIRSKIRERPSPVMASNRPIFKSSNARPCLEIMIKQGCVSVCVCVCLDSDPSAGHKLWKPSQVCLGFGSDERRDNLTLGQ